jgi:hypothetical protein
MGVGPNYVLDKGHVANGSTAYAQGELVVSAGDGTQMVRATSAGAKVRGVCMEAIDATRLVNSGGKAILDVRLLGIARVLTGAAVAVDDAVTNDATARAVTVATAVGLKQSFGIALTAASGAGQFIDVLLTPYATVNTAVS